MVKEFGSILSERSGQMLVWLETLKLDYEAASEDPAVDASLPEVAEDEEILGTLSPSLRKFACLIDSKQKEVQSAMELLKSLPDAKKHEHSRLLIQLGLMLAAYSQLFYVEVALELEKKGRTDIWEKLQFMDFRKGWKVVATVPLSIYIIGANTDGEDFDDGPPAPKSQKPKGKRRLN